MQQFNNVVIEMKFTVKEEISYNERDMTYNISFQVSYRICNLYLTKLTLYQNPKRNFEMIKSMGNFCVARQLFLFYLLSLQVHGYGARRTMHYCNSRQRKRQRLCKHNHAEEICQQEVSLDKAISSLQFLAC